MLHGMMCAEWYAARYAGRGEERLGRLQSERASNRKLLWFQEGPAHPVQPWPDSQLPSNLDAEVWALVSWEETQKVTWLG